jgi:hypothetical protein
VHRRALLASVATAGVTSTTGCLDGLTGAQKTAFQLGYVQIFNLTGTGHQFTIRVSRDGTEVHRSTHEVPGQDGSVAESATPECNWGRTAGMYDVAVRVDGGDWDTVSSEDYDANEDCALALVEGMYRGADRLELGYRRACDLDTPPEGLCSFDD